MFTLSFPASVFVGAVQRHCVSHQIYKNGGLFIFVCVCMCSFVTYRRQTAGPNGMKFGMGTGMGCETVCGCVTWPLP